MEKDDATDVVLWVLWCELEDRRMSCIANANGNVLQQKADYVTLVLFLVVNGEEEV